MSSNNIPHYDSEADLEHFDQKTALSIRRRYVCAKCYHEKGIAAHLHMIQVPHGEDFDRFSVICTECGENVAKRNVGRITIWFLTQLGQKCMSRAMDIRDYNRRIERVKEELAGTYHFDEAEALKELGF